MLDEDASTIMRLLDVGGRPVGVAQTTDGKLWVADADAGAAVQVDPQSGERLAAIEIGSDLNGLAATRDGHYLVLSSANPDQALYAVDLLKSVLGQGSDAVRQLAVPGGVLALAVGAETTRAYATTGDGKLVYWDLVDNALTRSIEVGRKPVALAIGVAAPSSGVSTSTAGSSGGTGGTSAGSSASGGGAAGGSGGSSGGSSAASSGAAGGSGASGAAGATGGAGKWRHGYERRQRRDRRQLARPARFDWRQRRERHDRRRQRRNWRGRVQYDWCRRRERHDGW